MTEPTNPATSAASDAVVLPDDPVALDDLAGELDDGAVKPDDGEPAEPDTGDTGSDVAVYGPCRGGPYDGRTVGSRFPGGFLLADKAGGRAYVYDWDGGVFLCRDAAGAPLDEEGRWRAAEGGTFDVLAFDPEAGG